MTLDIQLARVQSKILALQKEGAALRDELQRVRERIEHIEMCRQADRDALRERVFDEAEIDLDAEVASLKERIEALENSPSSEDDTDDK